MRYIFVAAGLAAITLAAMAITWRRNAKCPWSAAEARYVRDGVRRINGLDIAEAGPETFTARTMFASLEQPRDS